MTIRRRRSAGNQMIYMLGIVLIALMASAIAVDFGFYFSAQNQLQTAADAAALAATDTLYRTDVVDPVTRQNEARVAAENLLDENLDGLDLGAGDVVFGYVNPLTMTYDPASFTDPSPDPDYAFTGGYNAVRVVVDRRAGGTNSPLPTIMANMLGINSMDAGAYSVSLIDQRIGSITDGGLRPFYACQGLLDLAMLDGNVSNNTIRIYGSQVYIDGMTVVANCPAPGSGNWGFADLRDCNSGAVGMNTMADWIANGYPGTVNSGQCYSTQPGNAISSNGVKTALDNLISQGKVVALPLYDEYSGGGSNTNVTISNFAGFVFTDYKSNGPAHSRYVEGYFTKSVCSNGCTSGGESGSGGGGIVKLRLSGR